MQPDLLDSHVLHQFRTRSPLTHCMTNDVVQTFTANVLLALGASPAMVIEAEEAEQFAAPMPCSSTLARSPRRAPSRCVGLLRAR